MEPQLNQRVLWYGRITFIDRNQKLVKVVSNADWNAERYGGEGIAMTEFKWSSLFWNPKRALWEFRKNNKVVKAARFLPV